MATIRLPFLAGARWQADVTLDGRVYRLYADYNVRSGRWSISLAAGDGTPLYRTRLTLRQPLLPRYRTDKMPPGELAVVCLRGRCEDEPGRDDFENGRVALIYEEAPDE